MRILSGADVRKALPMPAAIEAMRHAFASLSGGHVVMPQRIHMAIYRHQGVSLLMPAYIDDAVGEALALKVVSLFPGNAARGLAMLQAVVLVFDPQTGRPVALMEGATLTAIRTAAACGLATDFLARPESKVLAVFGAGVQARAQLQAMCCVRPIKTAWIYDPLPGRAETLIAEQAGRDGVCADLRLAADSAEALAEADIVCTATTAVNPVFEDADLRKGTHINAIGSYQPHVSEIPPQTVARALVVVDSRQAAFDEAGDIIQPISDGLIDAGHIHAELGELILGEKHARKSARQITLFKSVGLAVQEAAAAHAAMMTAEQADLGTVVPW
jgi:ornithine cyclodeaminase